MYFGFRAPALRFAVSLFQHLYPPWSPVSFSLSHSCTRGVSARVGLAALWLAKKWNFLKKYLNCFFCFFCVFEVLVILGLLFCFPQPREKCCDRFEGHALPILLCRVLAALPFIEGILWDHLLVIQAIKKHPEQICKWVETAIGWASQQQGKQWCVDQRVSEWTKAVNKYSLPSTRLYTLLMLQTLTAICLYYFIPFILFKSNIFRYWGSCFLLYSYQIKHFTNSRSVWKTKSDFVQKTWAKVISALWGIKYLKCLNNWNYFSLTVEKGEHW